MTAIEVGKPRGPRERQKAETRNRILQAALEAFAARGFEGASLRDVAAAADVNHGLIKYHFQDKDRLWKAAVDYLFDRLHSELEPPADEDDLPPLESLRAWVHRYVRYCARHPEHARIMVQESIRDSDRLKWAVEHHIRLDHQPLVEGMQNNKDLGIYPDIPAYSLVYILTASAQNLFMLAAEVKHLYGVDVHDDAVVEAHAEAIFNMLFLHRARPAGAE